jgi:hypothetical protein
VAAPAGDDQVLYFRTGTALKRMALQYDALLADVYWIRAVQYFGGQTLAARARLPHDLLYPLLDITTTLDPRFNIAYRFGAVFLAEGYPEPPGRPDLSIRLLEKGFAANPTKWQYLYDAAFVNYWWLRDYEAAARYFKRASAIPGSPEWLPGLAAMTLTHGGDRQGARFMWQQIFQTAEAGYMRETARRRLMQLDIMDELDTLDSLLARASADAGHPVTSWDVLARRGWLRRDPPVDPAGVPYEIDPHTGRSALSAQSPYAPLPRDIPRLPPAHRPS